MKSITIKSLLDQGQVWAGQLTPKDKGLSSGYPELDQRLAQNGWPRHGIIDIQTPGPGHGELQLVLPSLAKATERLWIWLNPPLVPCAQGLKQAGLDLTRCLVINTASHADALWTLERCLQSGCIATALAWLDKAPDNRALRRLQMAAQTGGSLAHLMHDESWPMDAGTHARIALHPTTQAGQIEMQIMRQRGGPAHGPVTLPLLSTQAVSPPAPKPAQTAPVYLEPQPKSAVRPMLQLAL